MAANATSFKVGNTAAVKHGARSDRIIKSNRAAVAESIRSVTADFRAKLASAQLPIYDQLVDTLTQLALVTEHIEERGVLTQKGVPRPAAEFSLKLKRQALTEWSALGIGGKMPALLTLMRREKDAQEAAKSIAQEYSGEGERHG